MFCVVYNVHKQVVQWNKNRGAVVNRALKKRGLSAKRDSPQPRCQGLSSYRPGNEVGLSCPSANIRKKEYLITFFA